jgi:hypothetical protein
MMGTIHQVWRKTFSSKLIRTTSTGFHFPQITGESRVRRAKLCQNCYSMPSFDIGEYELFQLCVCGVPLVLLLFFQFQLKPNDLIQLL